MKQSGNGGQGQAHCIKRNSKSFFMCRTASWRSASKLESTLLATIPLFPQNFSISIYRAGMTLGAVGICFHVVLLGEGITCLHYIVNTLKNFTGQSFWARGYFVSTVGRDEQKIREYIRNQEAEDRRLEQLSLLK